MTGSKGHNQLAQPLCSTVSPSSTCKDLSLPERPSRPGPFPGISFILSDSSWLKLPYQRSLQAWPGSRLQKPKSPADGAQGLGPGDKSGSDLPSTQAGPTDGAPPTPLLQSLGPLQLLHGSQPFWVQAASQ